MEEKEKANELVDKMLSKSPNIQDGISRIDTIYAKLCAKIAVNEILNLNCVWYEKEFAESKGMDLSCTKEFWQSVLKAI